MNFALALTVSEILTFKKNYLQKVGQDHGVQFYEVSPFDGKYQNLQLSSTHFLQLLVHGLKAKGGLTVNAPFHHDAVKHP